MTPERAEQVISEYVAACDRGDPRALAIHRELGESVKVSKAKKPKTVHMAGKTRGDGAVSARCFAKPRPIDLKVATWTFRPEAVTCPKCIALAAEQTSTETGEQK